jgi:O-methyltransferase
MKKIARSLFGLLPASTRDAVYRKRFAYSRPKLFPAFEDYTFTDERLKFVHILEALNYVRVAGAHGVIPPVYLEFGCHSGRTFSSAVRAAKFLNMTDAQFFAFDSFEGLPATDPAEDGVFRTGTFATSREDFVRIVSEKTGVALQEEHVIRGFYNDSLTPELQKRMPAAGVVHIDVDLYSSTVEVLRFIKPLMVVGTVLIFDDWYAFPPGADKGEARALREFREANPGFAIEEWKAYSTFGKSFFVTSLPYDDSRSRRDTR